MLIDAKGLLLGDFWELLQDASSVDVIKLLKRHLLVHLKDAQES